MFIQYTGWPKILQNLIQYFFKNFQRLFQKNSRLFLETFYWYYRHYPAVAPLWKQRKLLLCAHSAPIFYIFCENFSSLVYFFFVSKFSARRFDKNWRLFPDSKRNSRLFPDFLPQNQIQDFFRLFPYLQKCGHPLFNNNLNNNSSS